jgi:hypothetical protein
MRAIGTLGLGCGAPVQPDLEDMTGDASDIGTRDEQVEQIATTWESVRRRREGVDRRSMIAAFCAGSSGEVDGSLGIAASAAAFGAAYGTSGGTQNSLVADLDCLEATLIEQIFECAEPAQGEALELAARVLKVHSLAALARRSAAAAFDHSLATAARQRSRIARHDIANAIGTVRNAIVLMEDETMDSAREHFRAIAKRNSFSSETLVRLHLSDRAALSAALGWEEVSLSDLSDPHDTSAGAGTVYTNIGALETIVDAIRSFSGHAISARDEPLSMSFIATNATGGVLTIQVPTHADRVTEPCALESFRSLAAALGLQMEDDSSLATLRFVLPLLARNERHDLRGTGQGDHADAVRL